MIPSRCPEDDQTGVETSFDLYITRKAYLVEIAKRMANGESQCIQKDQCTFMKPDLYGIFYNDQAPVRVT